MDLFTAIESRCSIREFENKPVPRNMLEKLVDAGRLAATARNIQPWKFVAVDDVPLKKQIAQSTDTGKFIEQAGACIVVLCEDTKYYLEDGSAATQNILLAATESGLGTCWVAGDKKPHAQVIAKLIHAKETEKVVSIIAVGYPKGQTSRKEKKSLKDVLFWNKAP